MSIKTQLQSTLDQLDSGLDKEKKSRAALEKQKRKVEGDLKMAQDAVADLERAKREIETVIASKEKNNQSVTVTCTRRETNIVSVNTPTLGNTHGWLYLPHLWIIS